MSRKKPNGTPETLPTPAREFLFSLGPTLKGNTCRRYRSSLRSFYCFLQSRKLSVATTQRKHLEQWFQELFTRGLSPTGRSAQIQHVRRYFEWLYDHQLHPENPRKLFRKEDFPKTPRRLPRPFPHDLDQNIIDRLQQSHCRYHKGLLLLRYTGMRIGELLSMPWDCLRDDDRGCVFIKVPLGKLDNERLVPLDEKAKTLVEEIKQLAPLPRELLLEHPNKGSVSYQQMRSSLKQITSDIKSSEPITCHRFRHSYATSLLNAGASLQTVMKLLGHRDIHMTLIYAEVTLQSVTKQYFEAIEKVKIDYSLPMPTPFGDSLQNFDPNVAIDALARWLKNSQNIPKNLQHALLKRLLRIREVLEKNILPTNGEN